MPEAAIHDPQILADALQALLDAPDLNLDELDPETALAIDRAREVLDSLKQRRRKFRVRYARVVIMQTDVVVENESDIAHMPLPGVYEGIPSEHAPAHVEEVVDYDAVWETHAVDD